MNFQNLRKLFVSAAVCLGLGLFSSQSFSQSANLLDQTNVKRGASLQIDGVWHSANVGDFCFDRGCIYAVDAKGFSNGVAVVTNLHMIGDHRYRGTWLIERETLSDVFIGNRYAVADSAFYLTAPNTMKEIVCAYRDPFEMPNRSDPAWDRVLTNEPSLSISIKELDSKDSREEFGTDIVVPPAQSQRSENIDESIELGGSGASAEQSDAGIKIGTYIAAELRNSIKSEAVKRYDVKLNTASSAIVTAQIGETAAAQSRKWKVIWFKRVRKGVAEYVINGGVERVHFKIVTGLEYDLEKVSPDPKN